LLRRFPQAFGAVAPKVRGKGPQLRSDAQPLSLAGGTWIAAGAISSHALAQCRLRDLIQSTFWPSRGTILDWEGELAAGILMGKKEVVRVWKKLLLQRGGGNRMSETRRFGLVNWEEITSAIEQEWRQGWVELRKRRGNSARATAIWFARHRGGMSLEQVRAELGASSYSALAMQVGRFQRELPKKPEQRKRLQRVAKRLNVQC